MTDSFEADIERYCHIYQEDVIEILNAALPHGEAELLKVKLDEEFYLLCKSVASRLREELQ